MSNTNNYLDYITKKAKEPKQFIAECETSFNEKIKRIAREIAESGRTEIVMLAGPSSSGKTTTAKKLCDELFKLGIDSYVLSLDDFYVDNCDAPRFPDGTPDFETVEALDIPLFEKTMRLLIEENEAELPEFDFLHGVRKKEYRRLKINERDVIVVEGLHALNPAITCHLPKDRLLKIYINVSSRIYSENGDIIFNKRNLRFIRRLVRDYNFRGNSVERTFKMWLSVRYGEDEYLFPFKDNADIKINTVHLYEPCAFKDTAVQLLSNVKSDSEFYKDAQRLIRGLNKFPQVNTSIIPEDSLLREFIGKE